ncbi:MAG: dockerin type I repeat-containing protein [Clostridia bacterium]|nr:dockerin type I repeat-containing protein [Clostridia bacterium]
MVNGYKVTLTSSNDAAYVIVQGDADSNGKITVSDYLRIKRHFMGVYTLSGLNLEAADVNGDGIIGTDDYLAIKVHFKNGIIINSSFTNLNLKDDTPEPTGYTLPFIPA